MDYKSLNIGCTSKEALRSPYAAQHFCWNESECCVLLYDGYKNLYKYSLREMREEARIDFAVLSRSKRVISACQSKRLECYFVLSDDNIMYVLRHSDFTCPVKFPSEIKHPIFMHFFDQQNAFLAISSEQLHYYKVDIKTNLLSASHPSSTVRFTCDVKLHTEAQEEFSWNSGYSFDSQDGVATVWDSCNVSLFSQTQEFKQGIVLQDVGSKENQISYALFLIQYEYLIVGYASGSLKVWKVAEDSKKTLIYSFDEAHGKKKVISLCKHDSEPKMIVSAGLDCSLRFWDVDTFEYLFSFKVSSPFNHISLLSSSFFISHQDNITFAGYLTGSLKFISSLNSDIVSFDKVIQNLPVEKTLVSSKSISQSTMEPNFKRVHLVQKNNQALSLDTQKLADYSYSKAKQVVTVLYSPPLSKKILSISTSPYQDNLFFVHIETGSICLYELRETQDSSVFFIKSILNPSDFVDSQGNPLTQNISVIRFLNIITPSYDTELTNPWYIADSKQSEDWRDYDELKYNSKVESQKQIALGCEDGSVVFVSMLNEKTNIIKTRLNAHREEIIELEVLHVKSTKERLLLTASIEGAMKLIQLTPRHVQTLRSFEFGLHLDKLLTRDCRLFLTFMTGELSIFKCKQINEIVSKRDQTESNHDKRILTLDVNSKEKIIITASLDNKIRLWNYKKILLLQISIPERLTAAVFITQQFDIVLAHSASLSLLTHKQINKDITQAMKNAQIYKAQISWVVTEIEQVQNPKLSKGKNAEEQQPNHNASQYQDQKKQQQLSQLQVNNSFAHHNRRSIHNSSQYISSPEQKSVKSIDNAKIKNENNLKRSLNPLAHNRHEIQRINLLLNSSRNDPHRSSLGENNHEEDNYYSRSLKATIFEDNFQSNNHSQRQQFHSLAGSPANTPPKKQHRYHSNAKQQHQQSYMSESDKSPHVNSFYFNKTSKQNASIEMHSSPPPHHKSKLTLESNFPQNSLSNNDLNMANFPHCYFSADSKEHHSQSKILPELNQGKTKTTHKKYSKYAQILSPLKQTTPLCKPLTLEQKYVCITALPKQSNNVSLHDTLDMMHVSIFPSNGFGTNQNRILSSKTQQKYAQYDSEYDSEAIYNKPKLYNPLFISMHSNYALKKTKRSISMSNPFA